MNIVIFNLLKYLEQIKNLLIDKEDFSTFSDGYNLATFCLREALDTRVKLIKEMYDDEKETSNFTNADYALCCLEYTDSLEAIFKELFAEQENNSFGEGYKQCLIEFFALFEPLQDWLSSLAKGGSDVYEAMQTKDKNTTPKVKRVRYLGGLDTVALYDGKVYDVISIEKGWYRIMTELDEDYLFPPELFEVVEEHN